MKIDDIFLSHVSDILAETYKGLSGMDIVKYCNSYAIDFDVQIPVHDSNFGIFGIPNKRTALYKNLQAFSAVQQFTIIKELCELYKFRDYEEVKALKEKLYIKYGSLATGAISKTELVAKTKHWLEQYPNALTEYNNSLAKYESGIFERNALDDMRLSLELLVKELLSSQKNLEKQIPELGKQLKSKGISNELRNMVVKIIDYYAEYNNSYIKHNNAVNIDETEYIIELSSVVMKFLIKILGNSTKEKDL